MPLLDERTAVVTGGAQGIGFAIAERFVAEGALVVLDAMEKGGRSGPAAGTGRATS